MSTEQQGREYVVRALVALGSTCPPKYESMLRQTPANREIEGLTPWFFDHDPESAKQFCSQAAGRPLLPFAQALDQDMMACFTTQPSSTPEVVVINPWAEDKAKVVLAELPDFEAWLAYAERVSQAVRLREQEESGDD